GDRVHPEGQFFRQFRRPLLGFALGSAFRGRGVLLRLLRRCARSHRFVGPVLLVLVGGALLRRLLWLWLAGIAHPSYGLTRASAVDTHRVVQMVGMLSR